MSDPHEPVTHPVEVSALDHRVRDRQVRIVRRDGTAITEACASQAQFEATVEQHRPGTDLTNPNQVHWVDHPERWSGV
jgi:hypothetical protein